MDQTLTPESAHEKALQILGLIEAVQALKLTSTAAHKIAAKEIAGQALIYLILHSTHRRSLVSDPEWTNCQTSRLAFTAV